MDQAGAIAVIKKFVTLLPVEYRPIKVFLFGSFARNAFTTESDIDIALVLRGITDSFQTQVDLRLEPHPIDEKDFNDGDPFAKEILRYGKEIITAV
jgi:predicted nucleotidyltransferase